MKIANLTPRQHFPSRWICPLVILSLAAACANHTATAQMTNQHSLPVDPNSISGELPQAAQSRSKLAEQEAVIRQQLQLSPQSPTLLYQLALTLRQLNEPKESLETYTQAARLQKPDASQLRSVALDYVLLDDYSDAIYWLELAYSADPHDAEVLYSLGRCYYTRGKFHQAEQVFLHLLGISPGLLKAEENLGLTYDAENLSEKADLALHQAAAIAASQPSDEWPFLNLGAFLLDHDRAAEAVPFLQKAKTIAPKSALCHEKLGRALGESDKASEGVSELETAVQLDPGNPGMRFELGHAYREAGQIEKARAEFASSEELRKAQDKH